MRKSKLSEGGRNSKCAQSPRIEKRYFLLSQSLCSTTIAALAVTSFLTPSGSFAEPLISKRQVIGSEFRTALDSIPAEVSIANTRKIDLVSSVNGHSYTITVALPSEPAPSKGYRVIYVLDGYGYFGAMTEAVRANRNAPGTIVVGIGYPDTAAFVRGVIDRHGPLPAASAKAPRFMAAVGVERLYDMTLPATDEELADQSIAGLMEPKARDVGGLDDFLKTVEVDIKPRVAALAKVDLADQTLFGHSLGGLAVVHALFTTPNAFRTFVAASPSIWWNHEKVLKGEAAFASKVTAGAVHPRVLRGSAHPPRAGRGAVPVDAHLRHQSRRPALHRRHLRIGVP